MHATIMTERKVLITLKQCNGVKPMDTVVGTGGMPNMGIVIERVLLFGLERS